MFSRRTAGSFPTLGDNSCTAVMSESVVAAAICWALSGELSVTDSWMTTVLRGVTTLTRCASWLGDSSRPTLSITGCSTKGVVVKSAYD
ncbi:Uncharacterised protein [Mycobacteroides abscessus subsp. abscessus]|nr:Uncharacterised protein [Mycobacteroides abscessus subsp. abscessus]